MTVREAQKMVDNWIRENGVRYFNELTNMAILTEEVGEVARIMARKYGEQSFKPGEPEPDLTDATFREALTRRLSNGSAHPPPTYDAFIHAPLSRWIESAFGLTTEAASGRLLRATPRPIGGPEGGAAELSGLTSVLQDQCARAIQNQLLAGYAIRQPDSPFRFSPSGSISSSAQRFAQECLDYW